MSTKLYVGNLPYEATESDLQALFEGSGQVASINIVRDRATGQARGFAFVEMSDAESATRAISELDKHQYGGRSLTVSASRAGKSVCVVAPGSLAIRESTSSLARYNQIPAFLSSRPSRPVLTKALLREAHNQ
jgi:RNA recognition motif-containing protein